MGVGVCVLCSSFSKPQFGSDLGGIFKSKRRAATDPRRPHSVCRVARGRQHEGRSGAEEIDPKKNKKKTESDPDGSQMVTGSLRRPLPTKAKSGDIR